MTAFQAILLGLVQGFSEFLPISSSAHLILTSWFLGWADQGLAFDMAANTGSLIAVMLFVRRDLGDVVVGAGRAVAGWRRDGRPQLAEGRLAMVLLVATLPVAVAGLLGRPFFASAARSPGVIAATSIVFGLLLWVADRRPRGTLDLSTVTVWTAFLIGCAQAVALVPGTSRAGVTLTAALLLGFGRQDAVRFSFLLAVPVGLLVGIKGVGEILGQGVASADLAAVAIGLVVSAVSAYAALAWLVAWVRRQNLVVFVVYRLALGIFILVAMVW